MVEDPKGGSGPTRTPGSAAERAAREARLAVEMRRNLAKRKQQARARRRPADPQPEPQSGRQDQDPDDR